MGPCSCHVHLLLSEPKQEYAGRCAEAVESRSFAAFDCDANHFWQKRYYDIRDYAQFVETLRYLHGNLVKVSCVSTRKVGNGAAFGTMQPALRPRKTLMKPNESAGHPPLQKTRARAILTYRLAQPLFWNRRPSILRTCSHPWP